MCKFSQNSRDLYQDFLIPWSRGRDLNSGPPPYQKYTVPLYYYTLVWKEEYFNCLLLND
jgi:hypothetical protein